MAQLLTINAVVQMPDGATGGSVEITYPQPYRVQVQSAGGMFTGKLGPAVNGFAPLLSAAGTALRVFGGVAGDTVPPLVTVKISFVGGPTFSALPVIYRGHPREIAPGTGTWDLSAIGDGTGPVFATPQQLQSLTDMLATGANQSIAAAQAQIAAQQAAASAAAAQASLGNAAAFADLRRQNAAQTRNMLNQIKGYRDGTATGQYYVNLSLAFANTASGDPISFAQVPKKYVATLTGAGVAQHGFPLLGSVVGPFAGSRSIKLGVWVLRAGFVNNTAQLALEIFWKNAAGANISTPLSALLTPDKLAVVGSTVTGNGIKTTVTDVLGNGWSYVLFELSCGPESSNAITSAEIHLQARGVTLSSDPTLTFFNPTLLMDAPVPIDPFTSYPESAAEANPGGATAASVQANTDAIAAQATRINTVEANVPTAAAAAAQTAVLSARLAAQAAVGMVNQIIGVNSGTTLPNQRLNGATVAFNATPATFPLPASMVPNGYRVTITSTGVGQHGFIIPNDGKWVTGRSVQPGVWIDNQDMTDRAAQFDLEVWWRDSTNTLITAPSSAELTLAQLKTAGFTVTANGITALVTVVSGRWSHVQFSMAAPANTANAFVHFRIKAAGNLGAVGFELPTILLDGTAQIDPYTVYSETAAATGGAAAPAGTLPRYTGGTPGNVVVLTLSNGANVWVDATTAMRSQLDGPKAIMGSDNYPYPFGAAVPITAGLYPVDSDLMLKTANAAGQPNMEAVPSPYPANHDPSTTFSVLMVGRTSHDGLRLISSPAAAPIYLQPPVGELGEYDFVSVGNGLTLPDLSGAGNPLTVSAVDGTGANTAPVYTARGLTMSSNVTLTTAATMPSTFSLIVAFRRANATSNHALFSSAGANGALWQLGGTDMRVWGDTSDGAPAASSAANPTATVNHIYGITINGLTVTIYDNGALVDTKTLTKPITSTGLIRLFTGNGNPFVGEAMYWRALSITLSATDHQAAYVRASGKISGRPA